MTTRRNWKREAEAWRGLATLLDLALGAIAGDPNYECQCGVDPYLDGEQCPPCFAAYALELSKEVQQSLCGNE